MGSKNMSFVGQIRPADLLIASTEFYDQNYFCEHSLIYYIILCNIEGKLI